MKLLKIKIIEPMKERSIGGKFWVLTAPFSCKFVTDEFTIFLKLKAGWTWDKRSGWSGINKFVPKSGSDEYNSCVAAHDCAYSGWLSRALADELFIRQGFCFGGDVSERVANIAHKAVKLFGGWSYYDLGEPMKKPYENHRQLETILILDK